MTEATAQEMDSIMTDSVNVRRGRGGMKFAVLSIAAGAIAILVSPSVLRWLPSMTDYICVSIIASLAFALASYILGGTAVSRGNKIGIVGIVLGVIALLMVIIPVAYAFVAPV